MPARLLGGRFRLPAAGGWLAIASRWSDHLIRHRGSNGRSGRTALGPDRVDRTYGRNGASRGSLLPCPAASLCKVNEGYSGFFLLCPKTH